MGPRGLLRHLRGLFTNSRFARRRFGLQPVDFGSTVAPGLLQLGLGLRIGVGLLTRVLLANSAGRLRKPCLLPRSNPATNLFQLVGRDLLFAEGAPLTCNVKVGLEGGLTLRLRRNHDGKLLVQEKLGPSLSYYWLESTRLRASLQET